MKKLNVRLLVILLAVMAAIGGVIHFAHELQVERTAQLLLVLADRDEAAEKLGDAANSLARYVQLVPGNTDAMARLGRAQLTLGHNFGAFATLEQVLRREPSREEERRDIVNAAMRIGRFADAREHLRDHVLKDHPDDVESLELLGRCQAALGEYQEAAATYEAVLKARPDLLDTYARLSDVLDAKLERPAEADAAMDRLVESNPSSARAWLLRASYRSSRRLSWSADPAESGRTLLLAVEDARRAAELAPDDPNVLLLAADLVRRKLPPGARQTEGAEGADQQVSPVDEARGYLEAGLQGHPDDARLYVALANLEFEAGRHEQSLEVARRGLRQIPDQPGLSWTLTELLILSKEFDAAEKEVAKLRSGGKATGPVDYLAARLSIARGNVSEGSRLLESLQPKLADWPQLAKQANLWLGRCYDQLEHVDAQLAAFRRAVNVDGQWAPARLGLAGSLLKIGRFDEAVEECRLAATMPGFPAEGLVSLARMMVVQRLRETDRDWRPVDRVLELAAAQLPDSLDVTELRAETLLAKGQPDDARACLAEGHEKHPDEIRVWLTRAALEERLGQPDAAERLLDGADEKLGDSADLRIGRLRLLAQQPGEDTAKAIESLAPAMEKFSKADQARLCTAMSFALRSVGKKDRALELAQRANALDADNLPARLLVFDLAIETRDTKSMEALLAEIRRIEGPEGGPLSRYGEALRLVIGAKPVD
ncbi:MAG: tetratricopeptide repeat protein, partial [Pirellulales bacterium]